MKISSEINTCNKLNIIFAEIRDTPYIICEQQMSKSAFALAQSGVGLLYSSICCAVLSEFVGRK